ncbi:MAG: pilus assembly protein PilM [Candidatus Omnitrophota bacterium]
MFKLPIFNTLNKVTATDLVGIDFSGNKLKFIHIKASPGKEELINILTHDINSLSDIELSNTIKALFAKLGTKNPEIIAIVPSYMVITKNIEIPSTDPREIKEIINLQASRYTPYSREEVMVDYIPIDTYKHSYTKILLVIIARNIARRTFEILESINIKPKKIFFSSEGLASFIPKKLNIDTLVTPKGIIHIDEDSSDFIVSFKNRPIFIRNIPVGAQNLSEGTEDSKLKFIEEIKSSMEGYQSEDIERPPDRMVLTGAVEGIEYLEPLIKERFNIDITTMHYFRNVNISENILKLLPIKGVSFLSLISSLVMRSENAIDLIPEEIKLRKTFEERSKELIKAGLFVITIFVLVFSILITHIFFDNTRLSKLNEIYTPLKKEAKSLEESFERVSLIKNYLFNRGYSLEVLTELYNIMYLDIELNDIRYDDATGKFSIKGTAESMSRVFSFVDNMENSKFFKDVKTRHTTRRKSGMKDVTDFELNCILEKES